MTHRLQRLVCSTSLLLSAQSESHKLAVLSCLLCCFSKLLISTEEKVLTCSLILFHLLKFSLYLVLALNYFLGGGKMAFTAVV